MQTTITEALAEIKTIGKRLAKKRDAVGSYLVRDCRLRDPQASSGGSRSFIEGELQSIRDLEARLIRIRSAIQRSNLDTQLTIEDCSMSVADWLTYRREVATGRGAFLAKIVQTVEGARDRLAKESRRLVEREYEAEEGKADVIVNVDEAELLRKIEQHETVLGILDGKLSLLNATTMIEID